MESEIKGRCPLCGIVMQDYAKNLVCDYTRYNFPYKFYFCHRHGIFVWRGKKHKLFDLSKRMKQAIRVEPLEPEVRERHVKSGDTMPTLSDYKPVTFYCPFCKKSWEAYYGKFWNMDKVFCPFCGVEISKEKDKKYDI